MLRLAIIAVFTFCATWIQAVDQQDPSSVISVHLLCDEAEAVLAILAKRHNQLPLAEADWSRLLTSEGYLRLKARETSMKRSFDDEAFKSFVLSPDLGLQMALLRETLYRWSTADMQTLATNALRYLPEGTPIKAKVYPVIKPATNSFVFDVGGDPAIFLYLDPLIDEKKFRNTVTHELHHIGFGGSCPSKGVAEEIARLPSETQAALTWIGAFGEGFAMLAAAGSPDIHPHAVSGAEEQATWDRSVADASADRRKLEGFFLDVLEKQLTGNQLREAGFRFFGVQGPWYTVGWQMAVTIERAFGRARLVEAFCDPRKLLTTYNEAVVKDVSLASKPGRWSAALADKLAGSGPR
jgi:Putative zinc dependent peptidase (DUF5700)